MSLEMKLMVFFGLLSVGMLIWAGVKRKNDLRLLFAVAISADYYSLVANGIGIGLGYWEHHARLMPDIFQTSVVYDMLFFPALIVIFVVYFPGRRRWWIRVLYTVLWTVGVSFLEYLLETYTGLLEYKNGWTIYKTAALYFMTFWLFCGLYTWLGQKKPIRHKIR